MTNDQSPATTPIVYRYGGRRTATGELADLPPAAIEQLRLAHDLRHRLLDIEQVYDEAIAAAWAAHPRVAGTLEAVKQAEVVVDEWVDRARQQRKVDRTTRPRAETATELKKARAALKEAKVVSRAAKDAAYPEVNQVMVIAARQRKASIKAVRQEFSAAGLYWATSNDVISHHNVAVARIRSARKKGQPAQLRRQRWDATGTLTVQPQRANGDLPRTPGLLASGTGKWANQLRVSPNTDPDDWERLSRSQQRKTGRGEALLQVRPTMERGQRVGPEHQITVPVQTHRMLPATADVVLARLSRRRIGSRHSLALNLTATVPTVPARQEGPTVALHVGWRVRGDRSLRVATWAATEELGVPGNVADVVVDHGGWGEVIVPARWRDSFEHVAGIRAGRDKSLDRIVERLASWLDERGPVEVPGRDQPLTAADVRMWRSTRRLASLVLRWRDDPPHGDQAFVDELNAWRRQDKHAWNWEANRRHKLEGQRDDAWRRVAAWLGRSARLVVVDDLEIQTLTRVPGVGDEDGAQARAARANRAVASPGRLRELVSVGAARHGAQLVIQAANEGTRTHYRCGQRMDPAPEFKEQVEVWCDVCGLPVDQDRNMAWMLLAASGQVPPPGRELKTT